MNLSENELNHILDKLVVVENLLHDSPPVSPIYNRFVSIVSKIFYDLESKKQIEIIKRDTLKMSKSGKHRSNQRIQRISEKMQKCYTLIK